MIRIVFYIFLGYLIFQIIRLVIAANRAVKNASMNQGRSGIKKEKDISHVAKILDEKRPSSKKNKSQK